MQAAVVPAVSSSWQVKEVPQPQPGPNQVLVKMHASGICYNIKRSDTCPDHSPESSATSRSARSLPWLPTSPRERGWRPCGYRLDSIHLRALRMVPAWPQNVLSLSEGYRD
jgi:hypothetical protein